MIGVIYLIQQNPIRLSSTNKSVESCPTYPNIHDEAQAHMILSKGDRETLVSTSLGRLVESMNIYQPQNI